MEPGSPSLELGKGAGAFSGCASDVARIHHSGQSREPGRVEAIGFLQQGEIPMQEASGIMRAQENQNI
jgi:hypothetical protein